MQWISSYLTPTNELNRPEITIEVDWSDLLSDSSPDCVEGTGVEGTGTGAEREAVFSQLVEGKEIFQIDHLLTCDECLKIIDAANTTGFGTTNYPKSYRGNLRLITVDKNLAEKLWLRIIDFIPKTVEEDNSTWTSCGLNECWRLAKYHPTDRFGAHVDTYYQRSENEKSMYTVNIYLNGDGDFVGGSTRFYQSNRRDKERVEEARVIPSAGRCVIFRQPQSANYLHDGEEVLEGVKYLLRSDVMYRRQETES